MTQRSRLCTVWPRSVVRSRVLRQVTISSPTLQAISAGLERPSRLELACSPPRVLGGAVEREDGIVRRRGHRGCQEFCVRWVS